MEQLLENLIDETGSLLFLLMFILGITAVVGRVFLGVVRTVSRERSRREIAAYISAGTMTPEQGERLMKAEDHRVA